MSRNPYEPTLAPRGRQVVSKSSWLVTITLLSTPQVLAMVFFLASKQSLLNFMAWNNGSVLVAILIAVTVSLALAFMRVVRWGQVALVGIVHLVSGLAVFYYVFSHNE